MFIRYFDVTAKTTGVSTTAQTNKTTSRTTGATATANALGIDAMRTVAVSVRAGTNISRIGYVNVPTITSASTVVSENINTARLSDGTHVGEVVRRINKKTVIPR